MKLVASCCSPRPRLVPLSPLGTRIDPQSDVALEFAPNLRLKSNWSRHFFSAEFDADGGWRNDFSVEDDRMTSYDLRICISAAKDSGARWLQLNLYTVSEESASMSRVTAAWSAPHCCDDFSAKIAGC